MRARLREGRAPGAEAEDGEEQRAWQRQRQMTTEEITEAEAEAEAEAEDGGGKRVGQRLRPRRMTPQITYG